MTDFVRRSAALHRQPSGAARSAPTEPPAHDALKAEWETFARSRGIDPSGLTKAEIIERTSA